MVKVPPCSARSSKNEAHLQCKATQREHSFSTEDMCQFPRQWEMAKTDVPMFFVKAFVKNRRVPFFFHIPLNGTEVNGVKERRPFLNMICFLVCRLFRMPMPAGYQGIRVREFPSFQIKKQKNKTSRPFLP